jgi:hypothetical protein
MLMVGAVLFAYAGMLMLCLGLERHYKQVWGRPPAGWLRISLRLAGWGALLMSFGLCAQAWGWAMGPVAFFGVISLAGFGLVVMLPYGSRLAKGL